MAAWSESTIERRRLEQSCAFDGVRDGHVATARVREVDLDAGSELRFIVTRDV
jgi:hypothetical protein